MRAEVKHHIYEIKSNITRYFEIFLVIPLGLKISINHHNYDVTKSK